MANRTFKIELVGDKALKSQIRRLGTEGIKAALRGVQTTAVHILNAAKKNLSDNGSRVTSQLFNSGKVNRAQDIEGYEVIFGELGESLAYAYYVEFGRRAGRMPPVDNIKSWIRTKGFADTYSIATRKRNERSESYEKRVEGMAWAIAKSIAKNGTPARPFLFPAFERLRRSLIPNIKNEMEKLIKSLSNGNTTR